MTEQQQRYLALLDQFGQLHKEMSKLLGEMTPDEAFEVTGIPTTEAQVEAFERSEVMHDIVLPPKLERPPDLQQRTKNFIINAVHQLHHAALLLRRPIVISVHIDEITVRGEDGFNYTYTFETEVLTLSNEMKAARVAQVIVGERGAGALPSRVVRRADGKKPDS